MARTSLGTTALSARTKKTLLENCLKKVNKFQIKIPVASKQHKNASVRYRNDKETNI